MSVCCSHNHDHDAASGPAARKALWIALVINVVMFCVELTAGLMGDSVGLQADAVDFFGDSVSYGLSLAVLGAGLAWRTRVAALKGLTMAAFGFWVMGNIIAHWLAGTVPSAPVMGAVGGLALVANLVSAAVLFRFRDGDANMKSVWVCSRNDALSNIAIIVAASGVWATASGIPDLVVAALIGGLALYGAFEVLRAVRHERATA